MLGKLFRLILQRVRGEVNLNKLIDRGLVIGRNCKIMHGVIIDSSHCWHIEIGDNVTIAPRVHIIAHDASTKVHLGYTHIGKVRIEDNVFVGAGSIILPNTRIGRNSIIGAGSVVNRDIQPNVVAAGNPARALSSLDDYLAKHKEQMRAYPCFGEEYTVRKKVTREMRDEMNEKMSNGMGYIV